METPRVRAVARPTLAGLPVELAAAARVCAEVLAEAGHRAWIVGGAVRDIALGRSPVDVDLATSAVPAELERLFPRSHAVGRAFGTVVVHTPSGIDVEVTTFRREADYADGRRPSVVSFGSSLEEDAERRDFTCNALYLAPLEGEFRDPTGGLADLAAGLLRCVGDPARRFSEDGLRLLRLARLAAELGLALEPCTRAAAATSGAALRGVSPERVLAECERMARGPAPARAIAELHDLGLLSRLPGLARLATETLPARQAALARARLGTSEEFFALLFYPVGVPAEASLAALAELRPARALLERVRRVFELGARIEACLVATPPMPRAERLRLLRDEDFLLALAVHEAWRERPSGVDLCAELAALPRAELFPALWITSRELAAAGVPRGPRFGALLRAAEDAQLAGEVRTQAEAEAWLARTLAADSARREDAQ
jgi:tRNA nucleotidyltransferase/poly(A) polymerase